jgi:hypothetical protein
VQIRIKESQRRVSNPYEPSAIVPLSDRFDLRGQQTSMAVEESIQQGAEGEALPVCGALLPLPFGYWQGDYFSVGLTVPATYCLPDDAVIQCNRSALEFGSSGAIIASTHVWHDDWSPVYPRGGHTRCGVVTMMNAAQLSKVRSELGLRLAWIVEQHVWKRESDYGDYKLSKRCAIVIKK